MLSVVLVLPFLLTTVSAQLETVENKENTDELIEAASYIEEKKYNLALREYNMILQTESENIDALIGKGDVLVYLNRFNDAIEIYSHVLEIDSQNIGAL